MPIRHHIPGRRKRRDRRHGRRYPTGWTRTGDRWEHPDGRWLVPVRYPSDSHRYWEDCLGDLLFDPEWRTGGAHPSRFEGIPF